MLETLKNFLSTTGVARLFENEQAWQTIIMFAISFVLVYLALVKQFEPLLLLPIAIGMLLTNLPGAGMFHLDMFIPPQAAVDALEAAYADGLLTVKEYGVLLSHGIDVGAYFDGISDVAFTEAVIGTMSTIFFVAALKKIDRWCK